MPLIHPLLEPNHGQFQRDILYAANTGRVFTAITHAGLEFRQAGKRLAVDFEGASLSHCRPDSTPESTSNYLSLNPPVAAVPAYSSVICRGLYPGIDWVLHSDGQFLEHDWRLSAGADPARIRLDLPPGTNAETRADGSLEIHSDDTTILWRKPAASQKTGAGTIPIDAAYRVDGHTISLRLGNYRRDLPLTIDPVIDFSYIINGDGDDRAWQVSLDSSGDIYLAGETIAPDFQTTPGAVSTTAPQYPGSYYNVWVRKLSSDTSRLIYSTYLTLATPPPSNSSQPAGHPVAMRVDSAGDVYIAAIIDSNPLPAGGTVITANGSVGLFRLSADGSRFLYSAQLLAGNGFSGIGGPLAVAIDAAGNAYVAGGQTNAYVAKVDPTGTHQLFLFSTAINGAIADIGLGPDLSVYVAGTATQGFAGTSGSLNPTIMNPQNKHGFLFRIKPDGSAPIFATWVGGQYMDLVASMLVDSAGNAVLGGQTSGNAQYTGLQGTLLGIAPSPVVSAFITKINAAGDTALFTALTPGVNVEALATDTAGNIYASGPLSADTSDGSVGVTAMKIGAAGQSLSYNLAISTVNSMSGTGTALAVDSTGAAYLAGSSGSIRVPEPAYVSGLSPNPFLLKIDPNPDQTDLELDGQPAGATSLPGNPVTLTFTIVNHGTVEADNVVFFSDQTELEIGGLVEYCAATGSGICDVNSGLPRVWFPSIAAGASEHVQFQIDSFLGGSGVEITASVYSSTSELNVANNTATSQNKSNSVPIYVTTGLQGFTGLPAELTPVVAYTISGDVTQPIGSSPGLPGSFFPSYAAPNTAVTIAWTSPYNSTSQFMPGPVEFLQWSDGNTDNPRTFNSGSTGISVEGIFQSFTTPYLTSAGVVNAASYAAGGVSAGEIIALFGFNLGSTAGAQINNGVFSSHIGNVTLTFDGHPAPLIYTGGGQTAAVVPWEIAGQSSTSLKLLNGTNSLSLTIPVVPAIPALFTDGSTGVNQAAALNQDGSINSPSNPAKPGDVIVLYGTGEGLVNPIPQDGALAPSPASMPKLPITVDIGGQPAEVNYAGEAPTLISGLIQINAVIPSTIQTGDHVPVIWSAGTYSSQQGVTIAVK